MGNSTIINHKAEALGMESKCIVCQTVFYRLLDNDIKIDHTLLIF